ncbi:MAG: HAMP domain-containing protein, partial [Terracidiphilus sp.]
MRPIARSLFLRIFLWFWLTVIVTGIALILTFILQRSSVPDRWRGMLTNTARYSGTIAVAEMERGGTQAAAVFLDGLGRDGHLQACLFDGSGAVIAGEHCDSFAQMVRSEAAGRGPIVQMRFGIARAAMRLTGSNGRTYIYATDLPAGPRAAFGAHRYTFALEWGVALLVSGFICYLLTRHITVPILQLRKASQHLAAGELSTRAAPMMERRHDELGLLVSDFNRMAGRIEELVGGQRQLICDVSHELRSPLARLNVALDLVREKDTADSAFAHMEQDLECLNEMIERLLTVARLDAVSTPIEFCRVNLSELAVAIVADAGFESTQRGVRINLACEGEHWVQGNAELLHSAIENVIRNAIHYTEEGTEVGVRIDSGESGGKKLIGVVVRDSGP